MNSSYKKINESAATDYWSTVLLAVTVFNSKASDNPFNRSQQIIGNVKLTSKLSAMRMRDQSNNANTYRQTSTAARWLVVSIGVEFVYLLPVHIRDHRPF